MSHVITPTEWKRKIVEQRGIWVSYLREQATQPHRWGPRPAPRVKRGSPAVGTGSGSNLRSSRRRLGPRFRRRLGGRSGFRPLPTSSGSAHSVTTDQSIDDPHFVATIGSAVRPVGSHCLSCAKFMASLSSDNGTACDASGTGGILRNNAEVAGSIPANSTNDRLPCFHSLAATVGTTSDLVPRSKWTCPLTDPLLS